jgi:hypothetical protein
MEGWDALIASQRFGCSKGQERDAPENSNTEFEGTDLSTRKSEALFHAQVAKKKPIPKTTPKGISIRSHPSSLSVSGLILNINYSPRQFLQFKTPNS